MDENIIPVGNTYSFKVTLRYRPYGNTDVFDVFTGNSEADAVENLKNYIKTCNEKHGRYISPIQFAEANSEISDTNDEKKSGRGAHFTGTTWVVHRKRGEKLRIPAADLQKYLDDGYERGGPRTIL